jgi:plastocyanin
MTACGSSSGPATSPTSAATTATTTTTPTTPASAASIAIAAPDGATGEYGQGANKSAVSSFAPGDVTIVPGASVTWTNGDVVAHTTTGASWNAPLPPGGSFTRAFPTVGAFEYRCTIHPGMTGVVTVK